ncbi:uncharacterized protein LOC105198980 [Solenopsis invicta]|uniref:uncharacterized protein LOC105198980 n=1 Tax=Solenopsis invicta TaxID=13686 RepID=UPI00193DA51F|nr:uncharacterized protein LOC105198980 [Solenopsis invicta]
MGKSSKAKKRKRSPSSDRLSGLERVSSVVKDGASPRSHTEVTLDENPSLLFPTTEDDVAPLTKQLFGSDLEGEQAPPWNEIVTQRWRDLTRNDLSPDQRELLLQKYSPVETLAFLKAPTLNQECKVALKNSSLIKRDQYNAKNHEQVGIALCALGEAISDFLRPGIEESLSPEACLAVSKVNEEEHRSYWLQNAKNTAEVIPVDDLLFGSDFGEQMKKVAAMEKSSKEIIKTPLSISRRIQQPVKQPLQMSASRSGNNRAPVRNSRSARRTAVAGQHTGPGLTREDAKGGREAVGGYRLPFKQHPPSQVCEPQYRLSRGDEQICSQEISNLLKKEAIEKVSEHKDQFLSPFFVIEKSSGGWRFILNLKSLNEFIITPHFKLEDWKSVVRLISPNDFLLSIDLEDAYLLVPIHSEDRKFLRFRFQNQLFQFRVLPFRLASAPFIFTKKLKPVISSLRERGFLSIVYLDDFILIAPTYSQCTENVRVTMELLVSLGFIINFKKSVLTPAKSCRFLGFIFDTGDFSVSIPPDRRDNLRRKSQDMLKRTHCKIRFLASFIGSLVAVCPAVQYGLLHTKRLEREKFLALEASSGDFEAEISLPNFLKTDLLWWVEIFTDKLQRNYIRSGQFSMEIFTDASLTGWGAVCSGTRTHGFWSPSEKQYHINYLELLAVFHALRCFASHIEESEILLRVDNSTAISYINHMESVKFPTLSDLAREIWCWCSRRNIFIYASYIPSAQNFEAHAESRIVSEETEWSLGKQYFDEIEAALGPFDIDLFASSINNKCRDFISWHPDPLAQAVDAFSMSWNQLYFYAFPPFILTLKTVRKIITDRAEGVVVVPWWPAQPWFPLFNQLVEDPSSLEENFPGGRKIIRQAFRLKGTPPAALETTLASISEATVAQYTKPIREWHFVGRSKSAVSQRRFPYFWNFYLPPYLE